MAFIYNIKNMVLTECHNNDVINICKKDPLHYLVDDKEDSIKKTIQSLSEPTDKKTQSTKIPLSRMKLEDLKILATELELDTEGLNCDELRKIIKDVQEGK